MPKSENVVDGLLVPLAYRQVTGMTASTSLPVLTTFPKTRIVLIQAEAQSIRWRDDGTAPTATVGMIITANTVLQYTGNKLSDFKMIEATSGAIANVSYYDVF